MPVGALCAACRISDEGSLAPVPSCGRTVSVASLSPDMVPVTQH